jgi:hypothetical protein
MDCDCAFGIFTFFKALKNSKIVLLFYFSDKKIPSIIHDFVGG